MKSRGLGGKGFPARGENGHSATGLPWLRECIECVRTDKTGSKEIVRLFFRFPRLALSYFQYLIYHLFGLFLL